MWNRARSNLSPPIAAALLCASIGLGGAEPAILSGWTFDGAQAGANSVPDGPQAKVERAVAVDGHSGKALSFEDWSVKNYLKPDPAQATRVVIPHDPKLIPSPPFRISAWIHPTADPIYYGGIVEKGRGFGASYRLLLLRGLKVEASLGQQNVSVRSSSPISLNEWHEVVLLADSSALALMVDGKEAGRATLAPGPKIASTEPLIIGERFTGRIDDVLISSP
ncbi:MAG TPA: LamG domain-containing protein [Candidatus Polarisedimenticolia bacterium]|jgi:hypothetical protein